MTTDVPAATPSPGMRQGLWLLLIGIAAAVLSVVVLDRWGVPDLVTAIVASTLTTLPSVLAAVARDEFRPGPPAAVPAGYRWPVPVWAALALGGLFAFRTVVDYCFGLIGFGSYVAGGDFTLSAAAVQLGYALASVVPLCAGTFFLLRWASRRAPSHGRTLAVSTVVICDVLQFAWLTASGHPLTSDLIKVQAVAFVGQLAVAVWAAESGRRTRLAHATAASVRRMPHAAQRDLIDLLMTTPSTTTTGAPMTGGLSGVGIGVLAAVATAAVLGGLGISEPVASAVVGGIGLLPAALSSAVARSHAAKGAELRALVEGRPLYPVPLTVFTTAMSLLVVKGLLLAAFWYAFAGWVLLRRLDQPTARRLLDLVYYGVELPVFLLAAYAILRAAALRLGRRARRWLLLAVAVTALVDLSITQGPAWATQETAVDAAVAAVVALLAVLAVHRRPRDAAAFVVRRLVVRLQPEDAAALVDLVREHATAIPAEQLAISGARRRRFRARLGSRM